MANYDVLGNIVVVKFKREAKSAEKKRWAAAYLKKHGAVRSVLEKVSGFGGRLRVQKTKYVLGEKTKEALYKESACVFRFNVDTCYFSPRLASERLEIAKMIKKKENVMVMFGGIGVFAIVAAKAKKASKIVSIELGKECNKYAAENVKRNKVSVDLVSGDVKRKLPRMKEKFDRIVMARPNLKDTFLGVALSKIKGGGKIHYYGFCKEEDLKEMREEVLGEAKKAKKKVKIVKVKKAGDIGVGAYRYRIDLKVLN